MEFDAATGSMTMVAANAPPNVNSIEDFSFAMFATILPLLVDRPQALAQWLALSRSVVEIYSANNKDWLMARSYIERVLKECSYKGEPYSSVQHSILNDVVLSRKMFGAQGAGARGPAQQQARSAQPGDRFCNKFNYLGGCTDSPCNFKHECPYGNKGCKNTHSHTGKDCPFKPERPNNSRGKPGGSRGGGSVTTTKLGPDGKPTGGG